MKTKEPCNDCFNTDLQGGGADMRDYEKISDRELLIRIDERQQYFYNDLKKCMEKQDDLYTKIFDLDKEKISKGSISWFITISGGVLGIISAIVVLFKSFPQP